MTAFEKSIEIRWSDLDPNHHLRHSTYYDYGAYSCICFLNEHGLTAEIMLQHNIGPILFREECLFRKEIKFGDTIKINVKLDKATLDFSRWTMIHELWKNGNTLAAVISVDGTSIDAKLRKLVKLPEHFKVVFETMPRTIETMINNKR